MVRLLLLPIPRQTLYAAQAAGALSEPWVLISLPVVLAIPVGLALGGAGLSAALSLAAGLLLILCLIGLSTLSTLLLHLLVRDRRRGELLALVFIVLVPAVAMLPGLLANSSAGGPLPIRNRSAQLTSALTSLITSSSAMVATTVSRKVVAYRRLLLSPGTPAP